MRSLPEPGLQRTVEPSARGGRKITSAIARVVREHDFGRGHTTIYARS